MRRFLSLAVLLFISVPFGFSVSGCAKSTPVTYCNAGNSGPVVGQVATIQFSQTLATYGESLSYGQIGQALSATAQDCKGNAVTIGSYTFASSDMSVADINPSTGQVCAGTWNRNSGSGVADYTTCTPFTTAPRSSVAYVTASAAGATSNAIPVYIHPQVTSVVIGNPTAAASCATDPDPSSNCCASAASAIVTNPYTGTGCLSQGQTGQLVARVYANGTTNPSDNITCKVGHITFSPLSSSAVVTVDQNGIATANQPGSTIITAAVSSSGSAANAGFFSTCPPAKITLAAPSQPGSNVTVALNNTLPLTAVVTDTNGNTITGLSLEYNSTTPQTISAGSGSILPTFPGTATITAVCQPGTCNPAPFSQIGLYGNGEPLTSNGITATSSGTSGTVLYIGSTSSQYLLPIDFTQNAAGTLLKLPFVPNSMVLSQDGTALYLGSTQATMVVSTSNNSVSNTSTAVTGTVLSVSPDGTTLVVADGARGSTYLVTASTLAINSTTGGVGTRAQWSPDSQTVYITAGSQVLVHSSFTGWSTLNGSTTYKDVAVTIPHVGAYFAGALTEGRTYCPLLTAITTANPPVTSRSPYPVADTEAVANDVLAPTNDGAHMLGAVQAGTAPVLNDLHITLPVTTPCPQTAGTVQRFSSSNVAHPIAGVTSSAVTGVFPASNSNLAFITYTGTGGVLPFYLPATGALGSVKLTGSATAPVTGVFSTDNSTFYTGTAGDNAVHILTVTGTSATDTSTITPKLPDVNGNIVTPNLIAQHPKRTTS